MLLALAGGVCVGGTARAADAQATPEALREQVAATIRPLMQRHAVPGMAVGLCVGDQDWVLNFGDADRERGQPVTDTTRFEIGSISKTFATTLAAWAVETGRMAWTDPPSRHLPALKGRPIDRATLRQLATYTAGGLPLQFPDELKDDADALRWFARWTPTAPPGVMRVYSNPSIALLGAVTARALGRDYAQAVESVLFRGFGMAHSHLRLPPEAMADYAWGVVNDRPTRLRAGPLADPAYGVRTTAADLLRYLRAQLAPDTLDRVLGRAVRATQRGLLQAGPLVQALGWERYPWPVSREWLLGGNAAEMLFEPVPVQPVGAPAAPDAEHLYGKTGSTAGFGAYAAFAPAARLAIVLLANRSLPIPDRVEAAWTLLDSLAPASR